VADAYSKYLKRVESQEDKVLFEEAVTCAENGALRAAYIMAWLSAAESLKRKFRVLAPQDDAAGRVVREVEEMEANHQSVDMMLLQRARGYGFVSDSDFTRLTHIYSMRCLFGHPYQEQPNEEAVLSAMADVVEIVLARPTKLRHRFIQDQISLLSENPAFLDDVDEAAARCAQDTHVKVADDLHGYLVERLLERLETIVSDASMAAFFRRGVWFLRAYLAVDAGTHLAEWDVITGLTRCPRAAALTLAQGQFWPYLSEHAREIVVGELLENGRSSGEYLKALENLHSCGALSHREASRLTEAVASMDPSYLASAGLALTYFATTIIGKLKSHNWYTQNPAIQVLENVGPRAIGALSEDVQRELGNNVLQAADGSATAAIQFLDTVRSGSQLWPEAFVAGILEECFVNDRNEVRFKERELRRALGCLSGVNRRAASRIVRGTARRVREGSVVSPWRVSERSEVLSALDQARGLAAASSVDSLRAAITELQVDDEDFG
jgi:hypothetical protein